LYRLAFDDHLPAQIGFKTANYQDIRRELGWATPSIFTKFVLLPKSSRRRRRPPSGFSQSIARTFNDMQMATTLHCQLLTFSL